MTKGKAQSKKGRVGVSVWNNEGVGVRPCLSFCIYQFTSANPNKSVPATINTENYIQYPVIINNGKEYKKQFVCIYVYN